MTIHLYRRFKPEDSKTSLKGDCWDKALVYRFI